MFVSGKYYETTANDIKVAGPYTFHYTFWQSSMEVCFAQHFAINFQWHGLKISTRV